MEDNWKRENRVGFFLQIGSMMKEVHTPNNIERICGLKAFWHI
jgi:hypothetical protein